MSESYLRPKGGSVKLGEKNISLIRDTKRTEFMGHQVTAPKECGLIRGEEII